MAASKSSAKLTAIQPVTNDAGSVIELTQPYTAKVAIQGTAPLLMHRWSVDGVEAKSNAAKGSKAKKSDDLESYVYRTKNGDLAIPGEYLRGAIVNAAKFRQDPRSPRKSAVDLFKAGVVALDVLATLGTKKWDFVDKRRVKVQQSAITRARPAMDIGWKLDLNIQVLLPEYIAPELLNEVIQSAGRLIGIGDFRPSFGRFLLTKFEVL
jgi:hypothetical protein